MSAELRIPAVVIFDLDDIRAAYDSYVVDCREFDRSDPDQTFEEFRDECVADAFTSYADGWKVERA